MSYSSKILADSISEGGDRLTTMEVTFPRFVLAEFNTHRVFSRNSASSRAIPVKKLIERVLENPAMPVWWGKYQKGMSAAVEMTPEEIEKAKERWLVARDNAVDSALLLLDNEQGLHKQITNRLLEPWMWQTVIVTASEWSNFFALRCNKFAQPEIRQIADMMRETMALSDPAVVPYGEWHLPLVRDEDRAFAASDENDDPELLLKLSTARCARVSYLTHDGTRDLSADVGLHDMLVGSGHMSPCEHPATPLARGGFDGNFRGWSQYRKRLPNESDYALVEEG